jgi:hypothetical protein
VKQYLCPKTGPKARRLKIRGELNPAGVAVSRRYRVGNP